MGGADSDAARRRLRSAYRSLHENGVKERDALTSHVDSHRLLEHMHDVEALARGAVKTTEMAIDAAVVLQCADFAEVMVSRANPNPNPNPNSTVMSVTPRELIKRVKRYYAASVDAVDTLHVRPELFSWEKLGEEVEMAFTRSEGMATMVGPIGAEPRGRRGIGERRRLRDVMKPQMQPEEVGGGGGGGGDRDGDEVDQEKKMAAVLRVVHEKQGAPLPTVVEAAEMAAAAAVVGPARASVRASTQANKFTAAVENLFHLSFLLRDGRAQLSAPRRAKKRPRPSAAGSDADGLGEYAGAAVVVGDSDDDDDKENDEEEGALDMPVVTAKGRPSEDDWKTGEAKNAAFVFQFDMKRFAEWTADAADDARMS